MSSGRPSRSRTQDALALGLTLALAILVAVLTRAMFLSLEERSAVAAQVQQALEVLSAAERARAHTAAMRGGGDFLEHARHRAALEEELVTLRAATADNPAQAARVATITRDLARAASKDSGVRMGQTLADLRAEEVRLLGIRTSRQAVAVRESRRTLSTLVAAAFAALALSFAATQAALRARTRAAFEEEATATLERRVAERTAELAAANARLREEADLRAATEQRLRQSQTMESLGQLTGGIAHDFNNMLAIVVGALGLARRRIAAADAPKALEYIGNAEEGADRAAKLTQRLLAFARRQPLSPAPIDVNALVAGMGEMLRRTLPAEIGIETVLGGGLWRTYVDRAELENAILNLAVNARDAMPGGGKLTIEAANTHLDEEYASRHIEVRPGQYVVCCVTDTGAGMSPETVERAFDPFFTTKPQGKGTGLGLSQVFGFVKQSGGHAKIYSEEGVGTTLKLYLPRHHAEGVATPPDVVPTEQLLRAKDGEAVLIVEDEQRVRHLSADALRELGYTVMSATTAEEALELLETAARIDLVFTDIVMPGMNGPDLARRGAELRPGLPVLFTTGYAKNAVVHNGVLDPGGQLISKPFGIRQLATRVRGMLDAAAAGEDHDDD